MTQQASEAFERIEGDWSKGLLLLADHAGRNVPTDYADLGLTAREFDRHIAYDIGVAAVTRGLAAALGAPAVLCPFSRLLVDPNRGDDDPTLIRQLYDGTIVPGNYPLSAEERERRLDRFYRPYHKAVAQAVEQVKQASGMAPFLFSVHSFTPVMQGQERPWHVGILWDKDDRIARPLIDMLAADSKLCVGDNEPYEGALRGDTLYQHATVNGYAHALIEIRQDLLADEAGCIDWVGRLVPIVEKLNATPNVHRVQHFGSKTGPMDHEENV